MYTYTVETPNTVKFFGKNVNAAISFAQKLCQTVNPKYVDIWWYCPGDGGSGIYYDWEC